MLAPNHPSFDVRVYGIGTVFSMALLSVVSSMVLSLTIKISEALWGAKIVNSILGNSTEGLTSTATQQGGIGLLLSILIVSLPPMDTMPFQRALGSASTLASFRKHCKSCERQQPACSRRTDR